jgi:hypothetical protein
MKKSPSILRPSIFALSVATLTVPSLYPDTIDTFDSGGIHAIASQIGAAPDPSIIAEGLNNILHLLGGVSAQANHWTYDRNDTGEYETIDASFDFRITAGTNGLADGLGFLLIPTSIYGPSGDGPNPTAEEPDVLGAFGLGIDVYPNINNISTHWNGFQVNELNASYVSSFRDNNVFNRVHVTLQRVSNATNASVILVNDSLGATPGAPAKIIDTVLPNMLPYENRVQFAARTGTENLNLDIDNVNVAYANPFVAVLPAAPTGHLYQDFDSTGTTSYRAVQVAKSDVTTFRSGPLIKTAEPDSTGAFLRIVNDNVNSQNNRVVFERGLDGGASNMGEVLQFDFRINSTDTPADGLGLLFLRTRDLGGTSYFTGDGIASSEEPNHANMLGIGFDVYPDGGTDVAPGVSLHWNGSKLADVLLPPSLGLNQFHRIQVLREPVATGLNVTVSAVPNINGVPVAPVTLVDHFFVPGASLYDYRAQFSARTGTENADVDIDNITSTQIARPPLANTQADFIQAAGSGWKGYAFGGGAAPDVRTDFDLNGNYLRLTYDGINVQKNAIAFDKQLDGSISGKTGIKGDVDFRLNSPTDQPADGMSLMLIPTAMYGNTGPGAAATPGFLAEEPNAPGVFGIGLDVYEDLRANQISLHWDGNVIIQLDVDPGKFNLVSGGFNHLHFELTQDASGMFLDLILTADIFGVPETPLVVFDDFLIPGMNLYDYRVEFAGRTGGLNMDIDLDNILVQTIPEPTSAALVGLGALLLARRRRQS